MVPEILRKNKISLYAIADTFTNRKKCNTNFYLKSSFSGRKAPVAVGRRSYKGHELKGRSADNSRKNPKLGSKGITVSGGESQRISLARALYKNSEILFLDEFTSSLDSKTEKKIIENLSKINKTMVIVSHKLSSLTICDKIYEINEGNLKQVK